METIIDITHIPFSCYGGMLSVSKTNGKNELIIHDVRQRFDQGPVFGLYIVPEDFASDSVALHDRTFEGLPFTAQATPTRVDVTAEGGSARIAFAGDHRLHIHAEGLTLLLVAQAIYGYGIAKDSRHYEMIYVHERRYGMVECERGDSSPRRDDLSPKRAKTKLKNKKFEFLRKISDSLATIWLERPKQI